MPRPKKKSPEPLAALVELAPAFMNERLGLHSEESFNAGESGLNKPPMEPHIPITEPKRAASLTVVSQDGPKDLTDAVMRERLTALLDTGLSSKDALYRLGIDPKNRQSQRLLEQYLVQQTVEDNTLNPKLRAALHRAAANKLLLMGLKDSNPKTINMALTQLGKDPELGLTTEGTKVMIDISSIRELLTQSEVLDAEFLEVEPAPTKKEKK